MEPPPMIFPSSVDVLANLRVGRYDRDRTNMFDVVTLADERELAQDLVDIALLAGKAISASTHFEACDMSTHTSLLSQPITFAEYLELCVSHLYQSDDPNMTTEVELVYERDDPLMANVTITDIIVRPPYSPKSAA